ncbi:MAG: hypothetical protein IT563_10445 [Alphaproteobacteria bacterium]|nr:hypothetical protein [Alphaproteobacteria bacterium]
MTHSGIGPRGHTLTFNLILAFVPDLVVGWAAARLTDSGWSGFFIILAVLQAIYFFYWFKAALWSWLLFWIFGKRQMAAFLENYFIDNRFPAPHELAPDLEDYLGEVSNNVEIDATTRVKAAYELGTLNGFKTARRYSLVLQVNLAGRVVLERYARLSKRFAQ